MSKIEVVSDQGGLRVRTPYNPDFVVSLKSAVPYQSRAWRKPCWIVDSQYAAVIQRLIKDHYGADVAMPATDTYQAPFERVFIAEYVGTCKERTSGPSPSAMAYCDGSWCLVLPESVLRAFFEKTGGSDHESHYDVLCIEQTATPDEIKKAYRRLARQWHPDVCKEPGADEIFKNIGAAYEVLSNPVKRKKYHAALKLEADAQRNPKSLNTYLNMLNSYGYRSPLRCGMIVCEGSYLSAGRFVASKILSWADITDNRGRVMTSFWSQDKETFVIEWV